MRIIRPLEEAQRQHHIKLTRENGKLFDQRVAVERRRQPEILRRLVLAEIGRFEQFLDQDHLRAFGLRLAHQLLGIRDIRRTIQPTRHLRRSHRHLSHHQS
jgi:hypothetical protein